MCNLQDEKKVYATLDTGKVMVFEPVNRTVVKRTLQRNIETSEAFCGWRSTKTLTIGNFPATCLCYIPSSGQSRNEVWVGCGECICVVSDSTGMVEDRINVRQLLKNPLWHGPRMVKTLVYWNDRVWCLINNSSIAIEYDVDLRLATYIFKMEYFSPLNFIVSEYTSGLAPAESIESVDIMTSVMGTVERTQDSYLNFVLPGADARRDVFELSNPELLVNTDKNQTYDSNNTNTAGTRNDSWEPNLSLSSETTGSNSLTAGETSIPPPVPLRRPTNKSAPQLNAPPVPARSPRNPPTVPPRSPRSAPRSSSCSAVSDPVERSDTRICSSVSDSSFPEDDTKVCSMVQVGDTLWVGRNLGDILVINIGQNNSFEYGKVITVLKVTPSAHMGNDVDFLLSSRNSVISLSKSGDSKKGEVIIWEYFSSSDIKRITDHWSTKRNSQY